MQITIFRRHSKACPHADRGRAWLKCTCPLWVDAHKDGRRVLLRSLGTRDLARARKRVAELEQAGATITKPMPDAIAAFTQHGTVQGLAPATLRRYAIRLRFLERFCALNGLDTVRQIRTSDLDEFRRTRNLSPITASKELETLRQFFRFCKERQWIEESPAAELRNPRHLKTPDKEPYTPQEILRIHAAAANFGVGSYERLRATALILIFRYTALRMGDAILLRRDHVSHDGHRWRIQLRTEKSGKHVYLPIPLDLKNALDCVPLPRGVDKSKPHPYYFWNGTTQVLQFKNKMLRSLRAVFDHSEVPNAHAHRFRHTLATEMLENGATFEEVADVLGNSPEVVRKHYAKWSRGRQGRIDSLMERVHTAASYAETGRIQ